MANGSAGQIKAGGAYVEVGIRDETRAALQQIRQAIAQSLRDSAQTANTQLAPLRANLTGAAASGTKFQLIVGQLAYAVEDASTQFGTQGFAGALRAASNNLTFVASQMAGVRGQIALTAGVLAMQLLPLVAKIGDADWNLSGAIGSTNRVIERGATARSGSLDREEATARVRGLATPEAVAQRQVEVDARKRRIEVVDMKSVGQEIGALQDMRKEIQRHATEKEMRDKASLIGISEAWADLWGKMKPEDILKDIDSKIGEAKNRELRLTEELLTIEHERAKLSQQQVFTKNQRRADIRKEVGGSMVDSADALANDDWGERRSIERERLDNLNKLRLAGVIDNPNNPSAGVDAMLATNRLADLQQRRLSLSKVSDPSLMPGTLQQGSVAAARQAELNRKTQYDPGVAELKKIESEAKELRTLMQELLGLVSDGGA